MSDGGDPEPQAGWVATEVHDEFPELNLLSAVVEARPGPSSAGARQRLRQLSDRLHGAKAVSMRRDPVPSAYRIFFRHIGLDPDATRPPGEAAVVERLLHGGFRATNRVDDALLIALAETGVPLWALDADTLDGPLGIRQSATGERLGRGQQGWALTPGQLVVADAESPVAVLFGEIGPAHLVGRTTASIALFAVQVAGVPSIHVEEALWTCGGLLAEGSG